MGMPLGVVRLRPGAVAVPLPAILLMGKGHFVTASTATRPGHYRILDPLVGTYEVERAQVRKEWTGKALVPEPTVRELGRPDGTRRSSRGDNQGGRD